MRAQAGVRVAEAPLQVQLALEQAGEVGGHGAAGGAVCRMCVYGVYVCMGMCVYACLGVRAHACESVWWRRIFVFFGRAGALQHGRLVAIAAGYWCLNF